MEIPTDEDYAQFLKIYGSGESKPNPSNLAGITQEMVESGERLPMKSGERKVEEWGRDNPVFAALNKLGVSGTFGLSKLASAGTGAMIDSAIEPIKRGAKYFGGDKDVEPYDITDLSKSFSRVLNKANEVDNQFTQQNPWSSGFAAAIPAVTYATAGAASLPNNPAMQGAIGNMIFGQSFNPSGKAELTRLLSPELADALNKTGLGGMIENAILGGALAYPALGVAKATGKIYEGAKALKPIHKSKQALKYIQRLLSSGNAPEKEAVGKAVTSAIATDAQPAQIGSIVRKTAQTKAKPGQIGSIIRDITEDAPVRANTALDEVSNKYFSGSAGKQTVSQSPRATISRISRDLKATGYLDEMGNPTGKADVRGVLGGPRLSLEAQDEAFSVLQDLKKNPTRQGLLNVRKYVQGGGRFGKEVGKGSEAAYMRQLQRELNADIDADIQRTFGVPARKEYQMSRRGAHESMSKAEQVKEGLRLGKGNMSDEELGELFLKRPETKARQPIMEAVKPERAAQLQQAEKAIQRARDMKSRLGITDDFMTDEELGEIFLKRTQSKVRQPVMESLDPEDVTKIDTIEDAINQFRQKAKQLGVSDDIGADAITGERALSRIRKNPDLAKQVASGMDEPGRESMQGAILDDLLGRKGVFNERTGGYNIKQLIDRVKESQGYMPLLGDEQLTLLDDLVGEAQKVGQSGGSQLLPEETIIDVIKEVDAAKPGSIAKLLWRGGAKPITRKGLQAVGGVGEALEQILRHPAFLTAASQ